MVNKDKLVKRFRNLRESPMVLLILDAAIFKSSQILIARQVSQQKTSEVKIVKLESC